MAVLLFDYEMATLLTCFTKNDTYHFIVRILLQCSVPVLAILLTVYLFK